MYFDRLYVVACAGCKLAVVPEVPVVGGTVEFQDWPVQPMKLLAVPGRGGSIVVVGDEGSVWLISLLNGQLPVSPASTAQGKTSKSSSSTGAALCLGACVNGSYVSIAKRQPSASSSSAGRKTNNASSSSSAECAVFTWNVPHVGEGSCRALQESTAVHSEFRLDSGSSGGDGERFLAMCGQGDSRSLSVVLAAAGADGSSGSGSGSGSGGGGGRWLKFDYVNGALLFERHLTAGVSATAATSGATSSSGPLVHAMSAGGFLWLVRAGSVTAWDPRYGVEVHSTALPRLSPSSYSGRPSFHTLITAVPLSHASQGTPVTPAWNYQYYLTLCLPSNGASSVMHRALALPADKPIGTLCHALGRLATPHAPPGAGVGAGAGADPAQGEKGSRKRGNSAEPGTPSECAEGVLRSLPADAQTALTQAVERVAAAEERAGGKGGKHKKGTTLHEMPTGGAEFLAKLSTLPEELWGVVGEEDWAVVRVLLPVGTVGLSQRPAILRQAMGAGRLDVLALMARHVPDLSERQAVRILLSAATVPEEALLHVRAVSGSRGHSLVWAAEGGKTKKARGEVVAAGCGRGVVMAVLCDALLQRVGAFAALSLSEAIRALVPATTAALILRTMVMFLQGLCADVDGVGSTSESGVVARTDEQVKRAATWAESLLDAHFSAMALNANRHEPTRRALCRALETVGSADVSCQEVETALGLWAHISRVIDAGGVHVPPSTALYSVEQLRL